MQAGKVEMRWIVVATKKALQICSRNISLYPHCNHHALRPIGVQSRLGIGSLKSMRHTWDLAGQDVIPALGEK